MNITQIIDIPAIYDNETSPIVLYFKIKSNLDFEQ